MKNVLGLKKKTAKVIHIHIHQSSWYFCDIADLIDSQFKIVLNIFCPAGW